MITSSRRFTLHVSAPLALVAILLAGCAPSGGPAVTEDVVEIEPVEMAADTAGANAQIGVAKADLFPHLAKRVDDLCLIHSIHGTNQAHGGAVMKIHTGTDNFVRPSIGSWVTYGLGSENRDLPGFVVMFDTKGRGMPKGYAQNWSAGFLPGALQGTALDTAGIPIANLARRADLGDAAAEHHDDAVGERPNGETSVGDHDLRDSEFEAMVHQQGCRA